MLESCVYNESQAAHIEFDATTREACGREFFFSDWIKDFMSFNFRVFDAGKVLLGARQTWQQAMKFSTGGKRSKFYEKELLATKFIFLREVGVNKPCLYPWSERRR